MHNAHTCFDRAPKRSFEPVSAGKGHELVRKVVPEKLDVPRTRHPRARRARRASKGAAYRASHLATSLAK